MYRIKTEEFEGIKGVIRISNSRRTDTTMAKRKRTKGQTTTYKTLHRKLKIEQHQCTLYTERVEKLC